MSSYTKNCLVLFDINVAILTEDSIWLLAIIPTEWCSSGHLQLMWFLMWYLLFYICSEPTTTTTSMPGTCCLFLI